jgi:hypothetical protein
LEFQVFVEHHQARPSMSFLPVPGTVRFQVSKTEMVVTDAWRVPLPLLIRYCPYCGRRNRARR